MTIQHLNDARAIARVADKLGAILPEQITDAMAHLDDLLASRPIPPQPGHIARDLAENLGDPVKMDKALKVAATALASADAAAKIHGYLAETCGTRVRGLMRVHAEEVAGVFGEALTGDLATLAETAPTLPAWFRAEHAADLDPETFTAWTRARDAYAHIEAAQLALAPLYVGAIGQESAIHFPNTSAAALRFANPPRFTKSREAYAFRDALNGRTERVQGVAGQGTTFVDGLFIPSALAQVGATFEWATPAEVSERAARIIAGMTTAKREAVATSTSRDAVMIF